MATTKYLSVEEAREQWAAKNFPNTPREVYERFIPEYPEGTEMYALMLEKVKTAVRQPDAFKFLDEDTTKTKDF